MTDATAFFDHSLAQIEAGHIDEAIGRLAGMLDHVCTRADDVEDVRRALVAHPLFCLLRHEPATATAQEAGNDRIDRVIGAIADRGSVGPGEHSARTLSDAIGGNALYRAIGTRVRHAGDMLARTWREGRSIAIVGGTVQCELAYLGARDLGNVTIVEHDPLRAARIRASLDPSVILRVLTLDAFVADASQTGDRFDLLYLPRVAEEAATFGLSAVLAQAARLVSATGSIVFPAFMPDRIGGGWQRACLDWAAHEHDAADLAAAGRQAGLSVRIFEDAERCLLWCVVSRSPGQDERERVRQ